MTKIALIKENNYELIAAENQSGIIYISLNELAEKLEIPITESDQGKKITIDLDEYSLSFNSTVPFVTILDRNNNSSKTQQLLNIPYLKNGQMFLSLGTAIELFDAYWSNADVVEGDLLTTSGVDGVYPPGLPVARVLRVERRADSAFARIYCVPIAGVQGARHVMLLKPMAEPLPERPEPAAEPPGKKGARK